MTLVNYTDADRNTIDDYLDDLEKVLESNKSMISTLREVRFIRINFTHYIYLVQ